jgi:hypothetical protein
MLRIVSIPKGFGAAPQESGDKSRQALIPHENIRGEVILLPWRMFANCSEDKHTSNDELTSN